MYSYLFKSIDYEPLKKKKNRKFFLPLKIFSTMRLNVTICHITIRLNTMLKSLIKPSYENI